MKEKGKYKKKLSDREKVNKMKQQNAVMLKEVKESRSRAEMQMRQEYVKYQNALAENDYAETVRLLDEFYKAFRRQWYQINKTFGFEVQDARLGGLKRRLESCKERLLDYADGKISEIAELEEPLLPFKDTYVTSWGEMISSNIT